tara:strand:+ start:2626 stop:3717 length:1092 start_codon:yes stop_codon:yes gene_type:complete
LIKIKNFIKFLFKDKKEKKFIFYSEDKRYFNYFSEFIDILSKNHKVIYVTSDLSETKRNLNNVEILFIGKGIIRRLFFLTLECKFFFITLSDLGNHELKKSKNCEKYVYIFHSPLSTHVIYKENAFDNYDYICCNGDYQFEEISIREEKYKLKKKNKIKAGYLYLDYLNSKLNRNIKQKRKILFAPTWIDSKNSLFELKSLEIIEKFLKNDFSVIFRPHIEHYKRSRNKISEIAKQFKTNNNFEINNSSNDFRYLEQSEMLVTDYSGIAIEYLFCLKRPVLYLDDYKKIHNKNFHMLDLPTFENEVREKFGFVINSLSLDDFLNEHEKKINEFYANRNQLEKFIHQKFYNVGKVAENLYKSLI